MSASQTRIPATIVTGFLGAGKTTLIRHLLQNPGGRKIALIVNEFGDVGFDGQVLADCGSEACGADDIIELSNGCICCTVADEFIPTMQALLARPDKFDQGTSYNVGTWSGGPTKITLVYPMLGGGTKSYDCFP